MPDDKSPLRELAGKFKAAEQYRRTVSRDPDNSVTATLWQAMSSLADTVAAEVERVDEAHQQLLDELWKMYYGPEPSEDAPDPMPGIVKRLAEIEQLLGVVPKGTANGTEHIAPDTREGGGEGEI